MVHKLADSWSHSSSPLWRVCTLRQSFTNFSVRTIERLLSLTLFRRNDVLPNEQSVGASDKIETVRVVSCLRARVSVRWNIRNAKESFCMRPFPFHSHRWFRSRRLLEREHERKMDLPTHARLHGPRILTAVHISFPPCLPSYPGSLPCLLLYGTRIYVIAIPSEICVPIMIQQLGVPCIWESARK